MSAQPVITVLLPVRDELPDRLGRALRSVLEQSFRDIEVLLLNDGSRKAETVAALRVLSNEDARVRLIHLPPGGLTAALNYGLRVAKGKFIARQDSDDWSEPDRLARQVSWLQQDPGRVLLGSGVALHDEAGSLLWTVEMPADGEQIRSAFPSGNPFIHGAACFRRDAAARCGGYRPELDGSEDYDFFWRLSETGRTGNLRDALYHYRITPGSISSLRARRQFVAHRAARLAGLARCNGDAERIQHFLRDAEDLASAPVHLAELRARQADRVLLSGHGGLALRHYGKLLACYPHSRVAWLKAARGFLYYLRPEWGAWLFRPSFVTRFPACR
ncbi:MAG: glycosyltransferase [Bryobacteraceae bacterium]|nr:glycosyltransferase [Bryobacteraceae bacterium]